MGPTTTHEMLRCFTYVAYLVLLYLFMFPCANRLLQQYVILNQPSLPISVLLILYIAKKFEKNTY